MAEKEKAAEQVKEEKKAKKANIRNEASNPRITTKARYWTAVGYTENMRGDWRDVIGQLLQHPFVYCVHDKDKQGDGDDRKVHVHIVVAFPGPTTYKNVLALFRRLNAEGKEAFNTAEPVMNMRYMYNYLIHDTDDARKKGKFQYPKDERIGGNNFDIGAYEQLTMADKENMVEELEDLVLEQNIGNYRVLYLYVKNNFNREYRKILRGYSSHFERLCRGNYLYEQEQVKTLEKEKAEARKETLYISSMKRIIDKVLDDALTSTAKYPPKWEEVKAVLNAQLQEEGYGLQGVEQYEACTGVQLAEVYGRLVASSKK